MIVTHYQNKTLYNKVFFGINVLVMSMFPRIQRTNPKLNNDNKVVQYDTKYTAIKYFANSRRSDIALYTLIDKLTGKRLNDLFHPKTSVLSLHIQLAVLGTGLFTSPALKKVRDISVIVLLFCCRYLWKESPCDFKHCALYDRETQLPIPPFRKIFGLKENSVIKQF